MNICAFIFARGGSKGLPDKNIRELAGKPLIAWSIEHALATRGIERVIVSTDSPEIAEIAKKFGAEVPFMRPSELADDETPEWLAWRHALDFISETTGKLPEVMVSIPTTAPLRIPLDIENCLAEYESGMTDAVITVTDAHRSPYFNMVKEDKNGFFNIVNPSKFSIKRRQDSPVVYDITTVCYVLNANFIMTKDSLFEGAVKAVYVPVERSIDIDTMRDFEMAEFFLSKQLGGSHA